MPIMKKDDYTEEATAQQAGLPADIAHRLQQLETEILAQPLSDTAWVHQICRHALQGGKRIRPLLLLLSGAALKADAQNCLELAGAVEFIHNATLLHDDVIDEAQVRHNRPSVNRRWGKKHGILAGDLLYARAFILVASTSNRQVQQELAHTACSLVDAEFLQLEQKTHTANQGGADTGADSYGARYFHIIQGKTARLFRFSCLAPAMLCGADEQTQQSMANFGNEYGLAFQLVDDLLDCAGTLATTGKEPGTDLRDGNLTLPIAHALQIAPAAGQNAIRTALQQPEPSAQTLQTALAAICDTDAVAYTMARAQESVEKAVQALGCLDLPRSNPYIQALQGRAKQILERANASSGRHL